MFKKIVTGIAILTVLAGCETGTTQSPEKKLNSDIAHTQHCNKNKSTDFKEVKLNSGFVRVYDFGKYKLHNYATQDQLNDQAYILETSNNLIGIEGPAFPKDVKAWKEYVTGLNKPLDAILMAYHPNGGGWQGDAKNYATQKAIEARTNGSVHAIITGLNSRFGDDFSTQLIPVDTIVKNGKQSIAGTEFKIMDNDGGYTIEIPDIKVMYLHMLGSKDHSILYSQKHIDSLIKELTGYKMANYKMIITAHSEPEFADALNTKIKYLHTAKKLYKDSKTGTEFIEKMKTEFPNYSGENYLEMSASNLFK